MRETAKDFFSRNQRIFLSIRPYFVQFCFCLTIIAIHLLLLFSHRLERFEHLFLDYFLKHRPPLEAHQDIVIVRIDDESVQAIGRWPWPWHYHAKMVELLREWGARSIVFDIIFKGEQASFENNDLETELEKTKNVFFPVFWETKPKKKYWVHSLPLTVASGEDEKSWTHSAPQLEKYAKALGHINANPDSDGVLRRITPFLGVKENYPHLAVQVAYDYLGQDLSAPKDLRMPLDDRNNLIINWKGPSADFNEYSYADLIRSAQAIKLGRSPVIGAERIKDKICIIGLTSKQIANLKVTPLDSSYASPGILANIANSILQEKFIVPLSVASHALYLILIGLVISYFFVRLRNVVSFILGLLFGGVWIVIAYVFFRTTGVWFYVFQPLFLILTLFIFSTMYTHLVGVRERNRLFNLATRDGLTGLFIIRYFREVLNRVVSEASRSGERLCVILIDIDNFKPINDTYGHPAGDAVLKKAAQIIESNLRTKHPQHLSDMGARYGGEEFIIMLRQTTVGEAVCDVGEKIRKGVEDASFDWEGQKIQVTVSIGVGSLHDDENIPDLMVRRADEALYGAKRTGKNRVCSEENQP